MTPEEFQGLLLQEHFDPPVTVERDSAYALDLHEHPFEAWALIVDGDITLDVDGCITTYRTGETFRLAAGRPHRESAGSRGVRYLVGRRQVP